MTTKKIRFTDEKQNNNIINQTTNVFNEPRYDVKIMKKSIKD